MKKLFVLLFMHLSIQAFTQIAISTDNSAPHSSAMLDVKSANKGLLIPRTSTSTRNTIPGTKGLMLYDTTTNSFWFHTGVVWTQISTGSATNYWTLNGTHLYNNNSGNVGIGTSTPTSNLHINRTDPSIAFYDSDDSHTSGNITGDSSHLVINAYRKAISASNEPGDLILQTGVAGFPGFSAGNVGIGTSKPNYKLSLNGDMGISSGNSFIGFLGNTGNNFLINAAAGNTLGGLSPQDLIFQFQDGSFATSGRVGIGTNAPTGKLHVSGSGELIRAGSATTAIHMTNSFLQFIGSSAGKYFMQLTGDNLTIGNSTGNNSGNLFMYGNQVAIGTNKLATGYKLNIGGKAICEELKVQLAGSWPDYVFDESYPLTTLENLETYIRQYKHLPNIPSAKEVEENGIQVGDMQKRMMEKIEELTLYIIDLKKQIDDLKIRAGIQ